MAGDDKMTGDDKMAGDDNAILPIVLDSSVTFYIFGDNGIYGNGAKMAPDEFF
jgi:hypothetical protein